MDLPDVKKYLHMLGQALQQKQVTGEILITDDIILLLDIRKPEEPDRDAYAEHLWGESHVSEKRNLFYTICPSRIVITRFASLLTSRSCVTTTNVCPCSRLRRYSNSKMSC